MKKLIFSLGCAGLFALNANAQAINESFNDITLLAGQGWNMVNASTPVGLIPNWFQGTAISGGGPFDAFSGAANSYIAANYNFVAGNNTISGWLMTPQRTFKNGDVITFYTRKPSPDSYADRLEVRLSTNGASTNYGGTSTSVGDFTTSLLTINPSLVLGVYPTVWTQYTITISGLPAPTSGRVAFRYFVTGGGPSGLNSDYIGIDDFVYTPYVCPSFTMTAAGPLSGGTAGSAYSATLTQTGALGAPSYAVTAGALPPGLTLSSAGTISGTPTATGTYNFTVTVSDNSGCSGSSAYSITVVCPANPTSLTGLPSLCSNGSNYTLVQGSPAGGTYSGTGVSGNQFNPASGSQLITYNYTDAYACAHSANATITVNTAPTVSHSAIPDVCDTEVPFTLTGGSPAGGVYSGTGVSGGMFDPAAGSQTVTYTYTDGNGCSNQTTASITVNVGVPATLSSFPTVCEDASPVTLSGGSPAGGVYSGTGVSAGTFDPSVGTQTITYTYVDGNGCNSSAQQVFSVNASPVVTLASFSAACSNASPVSLSGGSPAGGTYSGTGVSGGNFNPSSGTQTITYDYTDGNGCSGSAQQVFTVNTAPTASFNLSTTQLCQGAAPLTLSGGSPAGGSYSGTGVSAGVFNPASAGVGTHVLSYTYTDGNGCMDSETASILVESCASLDENASAALKLYPNPTSGEFVIEGLSFDELQSIQLVDLSGRAVQFTYKASAKGIEINMNEAPAGHYLIQGQNATGSFRLKVEKF